ncbi:MAG TPA: hypothetical protein VGG03_11245, partial [Thermoanaerobaculia bacterium]
QDRANEVEGFRDTFQRLVEVEERFKAYSQADLAADLRSALEQRLAARVPAATLEGSPAAFRAAAAAARKSEPAAPTPREPRAGKPAPVTAGPPVQPAPAGAPQIQIGPAGARPLAAAELEKLDQARKLLAEPRPARDLKEAFQLAREVADAHPELKEAQHLAAEGAYRISRWNDAAAYFRRGGDPGEGEPERLFYMAVCLYELGDGSAAAAALKRSLPNLKRTAYVDTYTKKILGQ